VTISLNDNSDDSAESWKERQRKGTAVSKDDLPWTSRVDRQKSGAPLATDIPPSADPPQRTVRESQLFTEDTQKERRARINDICDRYDIKGSPLELDRTDLSQLIVDDQNGILYCYIPKVACTNWKRIMMILTGSSKGETNPLDIQASDSHLKNGFKTLNQFSNSEILYRVNHYLKFMFVRHPFERLLSAYKNKFHERYSVYFQKKFGRKIIRRYRPEAKAESLVYGNDVTFREFVTYVLDPRTHIEGLNEHWRQYYKLCHPCHIPYDVIGKYETLYPDARVVLEKAQVDHKVSFPTYPPSFKKAKTIDYIRDFYSTIPSQDIRDLKATYGLDFEFFGYKYPFLNDSAAP